MASWLLASLIQLHLLAAPGDLKWKFEISFPSAPAIGMDGTVYFSSYEGTIFAVDGSTGEKKWENATGVIGRQVSPAIGADGTVYVGLAIGRVEALAPSTGHRKWVYEVGESVHSGLNSPSIGPDGTLYLTADGSFIHALDGTTGARKWRRSFPGSLFMPELGSTPATGAEGTIYFGAIDHKFRALNGQTGERIWEFATFEGPGFPVSPLTSAALGPDETLYFGSPRFNYALDRATGQLKWQFQGGGGFSFPPIIGPDGTVYMSGSGQLVPNTIAALDGVTGQLKWEFVPEGAVMGSPALGMDGTLYFGQYAASLAALDGASGQIKWEFPNEGASSSPALASNGTVYFATHTGIISLESSSVGGLAPSSWPKDRGNNRNTGLEPFAPRILEPVESRVSRENQPESLSVLIGSEPPPSYQWFFHELPIAGATDSSYVIPSLSRVHEGAYSLVASNLLGTVTSGPATLLVHNVASLDFPGQLLRGTPGTMAEIQYTEDLRAPAAWHRLGEVGLETTASVFADRTAEGVGRRFYRGIGAATSLEIWMLPGWEFTGPAGAQYRIDYVDLKAIAGGWQFLTTLTLPGSPHLFIDFSATNNLLRYYRTSPIP